MLRYTLTTWQCQILLAQQKIKAPRPGRKQGGTELCFFITGHQDSEMVAHALRRWYDPLQDWVQRLIRRIGVSAAAGGIARIYNLIPCSELCI